PRPGRRRSGEGGQPVRSGVVGRGGAGLLRGTEESLQGERQPRGDRAARRCERAALAVVARRLRAVGELVARPGGTGPVAIIRAPVVAVAQLVESRIV